MGTIVGVDGSPGSKRALDWALAEARLRAATLEVVYTYHSPETFDPFAYVKLHEAVPDAEELLQGEAERLVDDVLVGADVGGVTVERVVEAGRHPARVLVDRAKDGADLLVGGSRGCGGFTGLCSARSVSRHPPRPLPGRRRATRALGPLSISDRVG